MRADQIMKTGRFKQALCEVVVSPLPKCLMGMDIMPFWGILLLPSIVKPRPADEVLVEAIVQNVNVAGIKVKVCGRIGMFEQAL